MNLQSKNGSQSVVLVSPLQCRSLSTRSEIDLLWSNSDIKQID